MIKLMRADLFRLRKSWVLMGIFFFLILFTMADSLFFPSTRSISLGGQTAVEGTWAEDLYQVSNDLLYYFFFIIPVFAIVIRDFSNKTLKNSVSGAVSKSEYFLSKYFLSLAVNIGSYLFFSFVYYFLNRIMNGEGHYSAFSEYSEAVFTHLPLMIAIVSAYVFLAFLLKSGAAFNSITLAYPLLFSLVIAIFMDFDATRKFAEKTLIKFDISSIFINLTLNPEQNFINACFIVCAAVTVLSIACGLLIFNKREAE